MTPKYLLEQLEKEKKWSREFPIISQSPDFPADEHNLGKCKGKNAKCCFLTYPYEIIDNKIPEADDFKEFYDRKNFAILKHNLENMFDHGNLFDGIDNKNPTMLGNSNWARIYSKPGADIRTGVIAFACSLLTKDHKCGVYPKRFEMCKTGNAEHFCDLEIVYEVRKC